MPRQWETYRFGNSVRLRRVGAPPVAKPVVAEPVEEALQAPDLESFTKAELVAEAESRGVDASGTKAEILERLDG